MNALERAILALFPSWAAKRAHARYVTRNFTGADLDRLRVRSSYPAQGPVAENRRSRDLLLNTGRDLDQNNSFAHGAFNTLADNIVGPGIRFQPAVFTAGGKPVTRTNALMEEEFTEWALGVDMNRRMHFYEMQWMIERELWLAGEILVIKVSPDDGRRVPLALEIAESERLAPLDSTTPRIVQGVEYGPGGIILAYHIYPEHPADSNLGQEPERIPASRVLHIFKPRRPNQVRGQSTVAPVARNFEALNQYMDHELTRARVMSSFALMIKRGGMSMNPKFPSSGQTPASVDANGNPTDANGNPLSHLEGGMVMMGGPNDSLEGTGPAVQTGNYESFVATNLRAIATGMNMSYELFSRDYTKTNFASARYSGLEDKRHWTPRQEAMEYKFCRPVWEWFCFAAAMAGLRPFTAINKRHRVIWVPPYRREYVDPAKEIAADKEAVGAGFTTFESVCTKYGTNVRENIRKNAETVKEAEEAGLELTPMKAISEPAPPPDPPQAPANGNGVKDDAKTKAGKKIQPNTAAVS